MRARRTATLVALGLLISVGCSAATQARRPVSAAAPRHWIAAWAASPQPPGVKDPAAQRGLPARVTLRQYVLLSADGDAVRLHLTDRYGAGVAIAAARVGAAASGGGAQGRQARVTFAGRVAVRIGAGAGVVSDPVRLRVHRLERLAITLYLPTATGPLTVHGAPEQRSFVGAGDHVDDGGADWVSSRPDDWYLISGIDAHAPASYRNTVVAFGDSITNGYASRIGSFGAWPDELIRRLAARGGPSTVGVVDAGINGNRVLSSASCCGPAALVRFASDALDQAGVRTVVLLEGTNDLGVGATVARASRRPAPDGLADRLIAADRRLIAQARRAGVRVIGATLLPFRGAYYWSPAAETERERLNRWIRTGGAFDGVIDFASVTAAPGDPQRLAPRYDSGDHLHPNNTGYAVMARAVDLEQLTDASGPS